MAADPRLQSLRGLACLLLVIYHVIGADSSSGLRVAAGPLREVNDLLGYLRMPVFALLAGWVYGLEAGERRVGRLLQDKARRLLLPMLVVGTLFAVLQASIPGTNQSVGDWRTLHLLPVAHYWFLWALFWNFLAAWACERSGALRTSQGAMGCMLLALIVHLGLPGTPWLALEGALYLCPYFMLGIVLGRHGSRMSRPSPLGRLLLVAAAALVLLALAPPPSGESRRTAGFLLAGVLSSLALAAAWPRIGWLARVGSASYAIFLYHVFFTAGVRIVMEQMGQVPPPLAAALLGVLAGVLGPMMLEWMLKRHPLSATLGLGQRWRSRPA